MALNNYNNLVQSVISRSFRNDITTDLVAEFVQLCEQDFIYGLDDNFSKLRVREMQELARNTISTNDRYLSLPDRYLSMTEVVLYTDIVGLDGFAEKVKTTRPYELEFQTPKMLKVNNLARPPSFYTITNQIEFDTLSDKRYVIEVNYIASPPPLSESNQVNDVLTVYPNVYLAGTLYRLYEYIQEPTISSYWKNSFLLAIQAANNNYADSSLGVSPTVQIEGCVP